jgi:signal transduction histidine kinase
LIRSVTLCDRRPVDLWRRLAFDQRLALAVRAVLFVLCLVSAAAASGGDRLLWFVPLALDIVVLTAAGRFERWTLILGVLDAVVAAVAVVGSGGQSSPLLPYLIAPPVATAVRLDELGAIGPAGASALVLLGGALTDRVHNHRAYSAAAAEWVVLALAVGVTAGRVRTTFHRELGRDQQATYGAAYRLLSQLRTVARQLSGGLDPVTISEGLLTSMRDVVDFDHGAVFARSPGGRLVPLALSGADRVEWDVSLAGENSFAEAWAAQRAVVATRSHATTGDARRRPGSSIALPLKVGVRTIGVVGLESKVPWQLTNAAIASLQAIADESSLRLETALLFDEVREVATVEERRRLAREIHDGIAQELASFGYIIDNLSYEADDAAPELAGRLRQLREEFTRVITELRLSIFDLRSEVESHGGLGAALSEYVRSVGTSSALTVHLSLNETPHRLPAETEAELLRIAQEAITNARKHARAENLWVTCEVDPPAARLCVEDDGEGMKSRRDDSFGLEIMRERAERLHAVLDIEPRDPRGTRVQVSLNGRRNTRLDARGRSEGSGVR